MRSERKKVKKMRKKMRVRVFEKKAYTKIANINKWTKKNHGLKNIETFRSEKKSVRKLFIRKNKIIWNFRTSAFAYFKFKSSELRKWRFFLWKFFFSWRFRPLGYKAFRHVETLFMQVFFYYVWTLRCTALWLGIKMHNPKAKHFGHMVLGTKSVCFDPIVDIWSEPARPDPARPSRFWEAYNSETVDYTEKSYQT